MKLEERGIEIEFTDALDAIIFDQMDRNHPNYHGISDMHRVDFVVEFPLDIVFVELKDPANPRARPESIADFHREIQNGTLAHTLAEKFVDTFFYRWAEDKLSKHVHYLCLVTLEHELLQSLSDDLARRLSPAGKVSSRWQRHPLRSCHIFNIQTWNQSFPKWPAKRLSSTDSQPH